MTYLASAEICRAQGWTVGTILEGWDLNNLDVLRITAIGEELVLGKWLYTDVSESTERLISLNFRDWHKVGQK